MSKTLTPSATYKPPLHPVLSQAIGGLNFDLEEELIRYRRKRHIYEMKGNITPKKSPQLSELGGDWRKSAVAIASVELPFSPPSQDSSLPPRLDQPKTVSTGLELPSFGNPLPPGMSLTQTLGQSSTPSEMIHQAGKTTDDDDLISNEDHNPPPQDYLASSEELLKAIESDPPHPTPSAVSQETPDKNNSFLTYLLSPLGVGSVLLVLITSALLGSIWMTPQRFSYLGLDRLFKTQKSPLPATSVAVQPNPNPTTGDSNLDVPNQEFVTLDLNNLSTLETRQPTTNNTPPTSNINPIPTANPTVITPQVNNSPTPSLADTLLPPALRSPQSYQSPPVVPSIVVSLPSSPLPMVTQYIVIVPYKNEESLQAVQKVVKTALVKTTPQGQEIQVGIYKSQGEAKEQVENLRKQGISALIIPKTQN